LAQVLQHPPKLPPISNPTTLGGILPLLQRTRILRFALGARPNLTAEQLRHRHQRRVR
jgi:hypothetical protein